MSGTGTLSAPIANIGYNGAGTVNQSGGTATFSGSLYLGNNSAGGHGAYSLSAGTLSTPAEYVGYSGTGAFTQTGGTNTVTSATGLVLADVSGSNGAYNLDGGTLALKALGTGSGNAAFEFGGGTLQATAGFSVSLPLVLTGTGGNAAVDTQGYALTLSGILSGPGGIAKLGSGTLSLTGANTYAGLTTIEAGELLLGPSAQGAVLALGGADLQGGQLVFSYTGTLPASFIQSILAKSYAGDFAAGSALIYCSTAAANGWALGWADNGTNAVTVMPTLPGDANLDGRVDINDLTITLSNFGQTGMTWSQGNFTYDGRVDINDLTIVLTNFDRSLAAPPLAAGFASVPEPSTLVLLGITVLALLAFIRRRRLTAPALPQ